jgi:hypothetical protein
MGKIGKFGIKQNTLVRHKHFRFQENRQVVKSSKIWLKTLAPGGPDT